MAPIVLWAVPRSSSTAFERVFRERGDMDVLHEPYSVSYYFSDERRSNRYSGTIAKQEYRYDEVTRKIFGLSREKPLFVKDMAFHVAGYWSKDLLSAFTNTFIIRHPAPALQSQYRILKDFSIEETGYPMLRELFFSCWEIFGRQPILVDAKDLRNDPKRVLRAYCEAVGVKPNDSALTWKKENVPEWSLWREWHQSVLESTGILPSPGDENFGEVSGDTQRMVDEVTSIYEELRKYRVQIA
jgi:hypothetical protein